MPIQIEADSINSHIKDPSQVDLQFGKGPAPHSILSPVSSFRKLLVSAKTDPQICPSNKAQTPSTKKMQKSKKLHPIRSRLLFLKISAGF